MLNATKIGLTPQEITQFRLAIEKRIEMLEMFGDCEDQIKLCKSLHNKIWELE